jgi:hypothetical protein
MPYDFVTGEPINIEKLKAFEAIVRADEREQALAAPTVQEPVAVTYKEVADTMNALWGGTLAQVQIAMEMANRKLYTTPPAQPVVPDAITDNSESPDYRAGWNECRELTIQMRKS